LYFFPHILLVSNKWKSERESRSNFLKTKTIEEKSLVIEENRQLMSKTLKRYFGDELSDKIISQKGELEGENRWVSILFNDISDYSTITENMAPEIALEFLNEYFSEMHKVIREFNGQILNYIGDSIMVVFGAPNKLKGHENKAIECAIMMRDKLEDLNQSWDENDTSRYWKNHGIQSIKMRIGIHTGSVIAGNVGSVDMIQYSTIGDTVNVAARLEKANKEFGTDILFGDEVYTSLTKKLHSQSTLSGEVILKGRAKPTKVYSI
jgi:adenylate cyclase